MPVITPENALDELVLLLRERGTAWVTQNLPEGFSLKDLQKAIVANQEDLLERDAGISRHCELEEGRARIIYLDKAEEEKAKRQWEAEEKAAQEALAFALQEAAKNAHDMEMAERAKLIAQQVLVAMEEYRQTRMEEATKEGKGEAAISKEMTGAMIKILDGLLTALCGNEKERMAEMVKEQLRETPAA